MILCCTMLTTSFFFFASMLHALTLYYVNWCTVPVPRQLQVIVYYEGKCHCRYNNNMFHYNNEHLLPTICIRIGLFITLLVHNIFKLPYIYISMTYFYLISVREKSREKSLLEIIFKVNYKKSGLWRDFLPG